MNFAASKTSVKAIYGKLYNYHNFALMTYIHLQFYYIYYDYMLQLFFSSERIHF